MVCCSPVCFEFARRRAFGACPAGHRDPQSKLGCRTWIIRADASQQNKPRAAIGSARRVNVDRSVGDAEAQLVNGFSFSTAAVGAALASANVGLRPHHGRRRGQHDLAP